MSNITMNHVTFGYDQLGTLLFEDVQLIVDEQWKLGLVGRNGRGKTTLLRMLQDQLHYQGTINHTMDFVYFPLQVADPTQLTFHALQEQGEFELWQLERELNLLACDPDVLWRPFYTLSGGEQTKVLLATLFTEEGRFPLIDEPTNHLDSLGRKQVADYLRKKKQGYILVSHDRRFLDETVDHILAIEKSQVVLYQGNFSTYEKQKARQDAFEQSQNLKLKKEISRLQKTAREKAAWSASRETDKLNKSKGFIDTEYRRVSPGAIGADAARMMKRSKSILQRVESQISEKEQLLKNIETIEGLSMNWQPGHHRRLVQVEDLRLAYGEHLLFEKVRFELNRGECLAVTGKNGSGKSALIQALLGTFSGECFGEIFIAQGLTISYVRQKYEDNQGTLAEFAVQEGLDYPMFLNNLHKLGMERNVFENRIEHMSMGQRKKVELAKSLSQPADLYFWDEPLNYLDVFNQQQIIQLLLQVRPTMLVIEHDRYFIESVSTKNLKLSSE